MKQVYFKTLAEFKRLAVKGAYMKGCYSGFARGERMKNDWRKITGVQSNAVKLETEGTERGSFFDFPKAGNCELEQEEEGTVLKIFENWVKVKDKKGNENDYREDFTWAKARIENGDFTVVERYRKQVAEYRLGVEDD